MHEKKNIINKNELKVNKYLDENINPISKIEIEVGQLLVQNDMLKTIFTEVDHIYKKDKKNILLQFIALLDSFDRVFKNIENKTQDVDKQTKIWLGNFNSIRKSVERALKQYGVKSVQAPDGKAIPGFHTVVETRPAKNIDNDTIIEEIVKGYLWDSEVLRSLKNNKKDEMNESNPNPFPDIFKLHREDFVILRKSEVIVVKNE